MAKAVGKVLKSHGRLNDAEPKQLPLDTVNGMMKSWGYPGIGSYMFAANSRSRADRAQNLFGYQPKAPSLWETMGADLLACGL